MNTLLPHGIMEFGSDGKWCLLDDGGVSLQCQKSGRLDWDEHFRSIPEILELNQSNVVMDVGAYIGDSTECFLRQGCVVVAFEPNQVAFECLLHNCPKAVCQNMAIGNGEPYEVTSRKGNMAAEPLHLLFGGLQKAIRMDDYARWFPKLDYLKIDVEGFESSVLEGANETILRTQPILHIEVNPGALAMFGSTPDKLYAQIINLGYQDSGIREVFRYYDQNWDLLCKFPTIQ